MTSKEKNFKNLLVRNYSSDFGIILQKCSLPSWFVKKNPKNIATRGWGYFFLYKTFKKFSCQKPLDWFQCYVVEMLHWWPSTKIVQAIMIRQKTWPPGGGGLFSLYNCIENFINLLFRNHWTLFNIICHKFSQVTFYQGCSSPDDSLKNKTTRWWGLFSLYIYIENFNNLLVRNHLTDFHIIRQKCSLLTLYQACPSHHDLLKKTWPAYFPCTSILKTFYLLVRNHWTDFNISEIFLWSPSIKIVQTIMIH